MRTMRVLQPAAPQHDQLDTRTLSAMYDQAAPPWDRTLALLGYQRAYRHLFTHLRAEGVLPAGGRVLDCGIGTAALSRALAAAGHQPFWLDGIDIAPGMLHQARKRLVQAGLNFRLHQGDARELPFDDACFDLVMSAHMLEHLVNPPAALREMMRVARPGAPLLVIVTRPGIFDTLIKLKWHHTTISASHLERWMVDTGLVSVRRYAIVGRGPIARWLGVAWAGYVT